MSGDRAQTIRQLFNSLAAGQGGVVGGATGNKHHPPASPDGGKEPLEVPQDNSLKSKGDDHTIILHTILVHGSASWSEAHAWS